MKESCVCAKFCTWLYPVMQFVELCNFHLHLFKQIQLLAVYVYISALNAK